MRSIDVVLDSDLSSGETTTRGLRPKSSGYIENVYPQLMANFQQKLLRLPEVKATTGLSKSTIYARISEGNFPKQVSLGPRLVVWVESDIQNWIAEQVLAARG